MDNKQPKELIRIVKIYGDNLCAEDDVCTPNSLKFRHFETEPQCFIEEIFRHLPYNGNGIRVLYAMNKNIGKWQNIGHIVYHSGNHRIYPKADCIPSIIWDDTYQTIVWCEYYDQSWFHDNNNANEISEKEFMSRISTYLLTDSHDMLMNRRYERLVKEQPVVRAFCDFEYNDEEAKKEIRNAFAVKSFSSYPGKCLKGLFLVSVLPALYAFGTGQWGFILPSVFCVIAFAVWFLLNALYGLHISNRLFLRNPSRHNVTCRVYDDFVLSTERNGNWKRFKTNELTDVVKSGKFIFLLYKKERYIVLDRQIDNQQGKNMEMSAEFRRWLHRVSKKKSDAQYLTGIGFIIIFLFLLFIILL